MVVWVSLAFPGSSAGKESPCNSEDHGSIPRSGNSPAEGIGYPLQYSWASLAAQMVTNLPAMQETQIRSIPGSARSPGERNGNPLQYSCIKTPMERGAQQAIVHGVMNESGMA